MSYLEEIDELIQKGYLKEARKQCYGHENEEDVQLRIARILYMEQKYTDAELVCEQYPNNKKMQMILINVYIAEGKFVKSKYEDAKKICKRFMKDDIEVKAKYVKILIKQEQFEEAEKICKEHSNNIKMLSQLIKAYIKQNKLQEASKLCEDNLELDAIKSQYITVLIEKGDIEKAKEICISNPNNQVIQSQFISILINEGKYEEAKELAEANKQSVAVRSQLRYINQMLRKEKKRQRYGRDSVEKMEKTEEDIIKDLEKMEEKKKEKQKVRELTFIDLIKTKIYMDDLPREFIDEVKNSDLEDWDKMVALMAIYKKRKETSNAEQVYKKAKQMFKIDPIKSKQLNSLNGYISSNKQKLFDWKSFDSLLDWQISEEYVEKIKEQREKSEQEEKEKQEIKLAEKIKEDESKLEGKEDKHEVLETSEKADVTKESKEEKRIEKSSEIKEVRIISNNPQKSKKNKNKGKEKCKKNKEKDILTMDEVYREEITKLKAIISAKANLSSINYMKEFNAVEAIEEKLAKDLRAKMQLVMYLRKYGLDKEALERLPQEYEIYDLINKMMMYKRADSRYNDSKIMEEILDKVSKIDGDNDYIYKLLDTSR